MSHRAYILPFHPKQRTATAIADPAKLWPTSGGSDKIKPPKVATARVFFSSDGKGDTTALSSLGYEFSSKDIEEQREATRLAVGGAVKALRDLPEVEEVEVDVSGVDPHAAAVGAHLARYRFTLKTPDSRFNPNLTKPIPEKITFKPSAPSPNWDLGVLYAEAQNKARTWAELPANMCTPTIFCDQVKELMLGIANVDVIIRDEAWAEGKGMNSFLSVTHGTAEPAKFLEVHYRGGPTGGKPLVFVGKGITFDAGGISLKPPPSMSLMRSDMGGAAAVFATTWAVAKMGLPINVVTLAPLTENMPGPNATKPGDVIYAMNGTSIEIDNTDAEGRLALADAIYYAATEYKPHTLIDVATLTGAIDVALGQAYAGVFTDSRKTWKALQAAGEVEYDRFWRMPISEEYGPQIYSSNADLDNHGGKQAGSCVAALFLKGFAEGSAPKDDGTEAAMNWAHIDIPGVIYYYRPTPCLEKGMTGRPVRALIEYVKRMSEGV